VNLVSAPVTMELDFAQAGGQVINDSANCGVLAVDYEMGNVRRDQGWDF
jgi:hypothetical protein